VLLAATLLAGGPVRRALGLLVVAAGPFTPLLVPASHTTVRGLWAIVAMTGVLRTLDLLHGHWSLRERIVHVLSIVDTRRLSRPTHCNMRSGLVPLVLQATAWEALALGAYLAWIHATPGGLATFWLTRWSLGLVFVYAFSEGAYQLLGAGYRVAGFVTPPLHIVPLASRSVQEFWGARWNRTVSIWLGDHCFRPLARRRRPLLGALLAFATSGLLHAYIAWVAVGGWMALWALVYFVSQGFVMMLELPLKVRRWRPVVGHVWTIAWMVLLSPGFTEPMARTLGILPR
jgi:hypothetical protein